MNILILAHGVGMGAGESELTGPFCVEAMDAYTAGAVVAEGYSAGAEKAQSYTAGAVIAEGSC